jgi:hypothetical protein
MGKLLKELIAIVDNYVHKSLLRNVILVYKRNWQQYWMNLFNGFVFGNGRRVNYRYYPFSYVNPKPYVYVHRWFPLINNESCVAFLPKRYFYSNGS